MIRKIIIRIIVAVAVAVILSKFKVLNILQVNAKEQVSTVNISDLYYYNNYDILGGSSSPLTFSLLNREWKGAYAPASHDVLSAVSVLYPLNLPNKTFTLETSMFTNANIIGSDFPVRAYVTSGTGYTAICNVESSATSCEQNVGSSNVCPSIPFSSSYLVTIRCENASTASNGNVRLFLQSAFKTGNYSNTIFWAFTPASAYVDENTNTIKEIEKASKETAQAAKETNDFLKDDTPVSDDSINGVLSSADESNSPISDLVSMPLTLLQKINTGMNGSCSPFVLGSLLGTSLSLPCINLGQRLGTLWNIIDMCMSVFMAYTIGMMCIRIYNNFTTLKDNSNDVYGGDI